MDIFDLVQEDEAMFNINPFEEGYCGNFRLLLVKSTSVDPTWVVFLYFYRQEVRGLDISGFSSWGSFFLRLY